MSEILEEIPRQQKVEFEKYGAKVILEFIGGVGDVEKGVSLTGSATKLTIEFPDGRKSIGLIDFGMFQGCDNDLKYNEILPFNLSEIDYVIVTHTHIDHIGKLLHLSKEDFNGTIWTTKANKEVLYTMLLDVIRLSPKNAITLIEKIESQIKNYKTILNKIVHLGIEAEEEFNVMIDKLNEDLLSLKNKKFKDKKEYFDSDDLINVIQKVNGIQYYEKNEVKNDIKLSFISAGHLPGSSQAILKVKIAKNKYIKLGFSGDVGKIKNPAIWGTPDLSNEELDLYMIESTYAGREHAEMNDEESKLIESINKVIKKGGKIIIPNFMQGRAQEVNLYLEKLMNEGKINSIPIFNHSTNIKKISEIYSRNFPEVFGKGLNSKNIKSAITGKGKKRQDHFDKYKGPAFLVVSGGMLDGGTIIEKLNLLEDPKNLFISTGYQAPSSLGNKIFIQEVEQIETQEFGLVTIRASKHNFRGFSGHADEEDLLTLLSGMKFSQDAKIVINHGEKGVAQTLFGLAIKKVVGETKEVLLADFNEDLYKKK